MNNNISTHKAIIYTLAYLLIVLFVSAIYMFYKIDLELKDNKKEILRQQEVISLQQCEIDSYKHLSRLMKDMNRILP